MSGLDHNSRRSRKRHRQIAGERARRAINKQNSNARAEETAQEQGTIVKPTTVRREPTKPP